VAQGTLLDFPDLPDRCELGKKRKHLAYVYLPWGWITNFDYISRLQEGNTPQPAQGRLTCVKAHGPDGEDLSYCITCSP